MPDDRGRRIYLHPGEGDIEFDKVILAARNSESTIDLCLESSSVDPSGNVDFEQIRADAEFVKLLVGRTAVNDSE